MGFAMLTPLLAAELAPDSTAAIGAGLSEDARYIIYGVATGLYPMMMFFGAPILGQLSDRVGRKRMLLICAVGIVFSYTILSSAFALGSVILVMVGRALGGMTAASQPISLAALVDVSAPEKRDFWLSMGLLASSVGFVVGPALSGLLSDSKHYAVVQHTDSAPRHSSSRRAKFLPASLSLSLSRTSALNFCPEADTSFSAERTAQPGACIPAARPAEGFQCFPASGDGLGSILLFRRPLCNGPV